ncbi:MAG: TlpA family protein disulfide reductase [bacterium]
MVACATAPPSLDTEKKPKQQSGGFSLELERVDGGTFSFDEIRGKKHLLAAFWATWCEPCKTELKKLAEFYTEFSEHVEFVAVSTDSEDLIDKVNEFAIENALPFPILIDPSGNVVASIIPGGDTVPYSIVVDKSGNIVSRHSGYNPGDEERLKKELLELLEK